MPEITIGKLRGGYCVSWREDGKRRRYQLEARTRKEAEAEALDVYRQYTMPTTGRTVADLWQCYLDEREGRPIAQTMKYTGRAIMPHFGSLRPDQITSEHCRDYQRIRRKAGIKTGSIWTELGHLRSCLNWAAEIAHLIDYAPYIERPQKPAPKDRYLTHDEIDRLIGAATEPHIKLAILLMLSTAGRVSAILQLEWGRVDLDRGQIDLRIDSDGPRKGRAVVPINAGLRAALQEARKSALSDHVVEWSGSPVKSIRRGFMATVERAGLAGVSPHVLRHTAAVHMAEAGVPMSKISQFLGHSNTSITERTYARFAPDHLMEAANVLDFIRLRRAT
ncbi:site-specific integrase [Paracoccus alkanivorans]|uniref:Site-specific integrase n=1 Tax=Paracoccus alkanivorans TaxID=2116655 RepID=A0A3M0MDN7_9RHOB|nr:site-specific integrase [Paracoccus alkanivorans]RMC33730.1 site-specific integrase [Paracoccus alkanivorans]